MGFRSLHSLRAPANTTFLLHITSLKMVLKQIIFSGIFFGPLRLLLGSQKAGSKMIFILL